MKNLYDALAVAKDATAEQIKKAYRKLAMKHHPDKGGDDKTFQELSKAYSILSDEDKRKRYDETGQVEEERDPFNEILASFISDLQEQMDSLNDDIIEKGKKKIKKEIKEINLARIQTDNKIKYLNFFLKRIKKDTESNIFRLVIENKIQQLTTKLEAINKSMDILKRMQDIFNGDLEYDFNSEDEYTSSKEEYPDDVFEILHQNLFK
jgi:curved DNA-binding protein CbpA